MLGKEDRAVDAEPQPEPGESIVHEEAMAALDGLTLGVSSDTLAHDRDAFRFNHRSQVSPSPAPAEPLFSD